MSGFSWPLQQSVYAALTAAAPAISGGRIYDQAPQTATFPYIEIGGKQGIPDDTSSPNDPAGDAGMSEFIDLHIWSRYRGEKEVAEIVDRIHDALHGKSLAVADRTSAFAWVRTVRTFLDADDLTHHGVVTVEIIHRS